MRPPSRRLLEKSMTLPRSRSFQPWHRGLLLALGIFGAACSEDTEAEQPLLNTAPDSGVPLANATGTYDASVLAQGPFSSLPMVDGALPLSPDAAADSGSPDASNSSNGSPDASSGSPLDKYGLTPFPTTGQSITAADKTWTWVDFPDTKCRDGSMAGIGIRRNSASQDVIIFLEGGGACFDDVTCLANPANADNWKKEPVAGILNTTDAANPLKDWNLVYIPYCTGDVHAGTRADVKVSNVFPKEQFVGYLNVEKYLQRIVPTFPNPSRVLLTGISAGGFGASSTATLIQRAYPNEKIMMIDDSGPPQSGEAVPACLQKRMRELWGLDVSILKDCGARCPNKDNFFQDYGVYLADTFDDRPSGLIESVHDGVISGFFGAGNNNCKGTALIDKVPLDIYERGLLSFRDKVKNHKNFGTWFPSGEQHTWLTDIFEIKFTAAEINGVKLTKWVSDLVDGKGTSHVGP